MHPVLGISLETLLILALVAANGFFVAAEFALVKVRASQLRPLAKTGGWRVRFALKATQHLDAALSATQLGITLASLALGWVGEPFIAHRIEPVLSHLGVSDAATVSSVSFAVAFTVITFLHIIFGELAPKSLAIQRAKGVTLWVSAPLMVFHFLFYPFIWVLNSTANRCLRWAGLGPTGEGEHGFSTEELEYVFSHARHAHPGDALANKLMVQSLRARETVAQQIMVPREQVMVLRLDSPMKENLHLAQTGGHSRFPVSSGSPDNIVGMLLVREWLWQMQVMGDGESFEPILRPVLEFGTKTPIHVMIERFRNMRSHMAIVRDDDKRFVGIVTFEDVLEEIVGDIRDELDIEIGPVFERTEHVIVVSGGFSMRELQAETGWPVEWKPRETVAAWMVRHNRGAAPKVGESVVIGDYTLVATEVQREILSRIRVERAGPAES